MISQIAAGIARDNKESLKRQDQGVLFCCNCKHARNGWVLTYILGDWRFAKCAVDLIESGELYVQPQRADSAMSYCATSRTCGPCGKDGKLFEPKT